MSHTPNTDEEPETITGDIVFILQLKEHPKFKRKGDDLYVEYTLSLTEALCGFQSALTHLDGRRLLVESSSGNVIKPGKYKVINEEGMPRYRKPFLKGNLYIRFNVEFPGRGAFTAEQCKQLETILPARLLPVLTESELKECVARTLRNVRIPDIEEELKRKQHFYLPEAYEEDDTPCAQQ